MPDTCRNCSQPHPTWRCPEIHAALFDPEGPPSTDPEAGGISSEPDPDPAPFEGFGGPAPWLHTGRTIAYGRYAERTDLLYHGFVDGVWLASGRTNVDTELAIDEVLKLAA